MAGPGDNQTGRVVKIRFIFLTYCIALAAGVVFKTIQYLVEPDSVGSFNSVVLELTIASVVVASAVSLFYLLKEKKGKDK